MQADYLFFAAQQSSHNSGNVDIRDCFSERLLTNAFLWPAPSAELENLFSFASWLNIRLFIPEPVEREVEEHWLREVGDSLAAVKGSIAEFKRVSSRVERDTAALCRMTEAAIGPIRLRL